MKKILISLLLIAVLSASLFAAEEVSPKTDSNVYAQISSPFAMLDARSQAMGGVGTAATSNIQALWANPAGLADRKVQVSLPHVGFTLYNPKAIIQSGVIESGDMDKLVDVMLKDVLTSGYGKILDANAAVSFTAGGFGLGVGVQDSLYTYAPKSSTGGLNSNIIDQLTAEVKLGYGFRINFTDTASMDIGLSSGFRYMLYNKAIDGQKLLDIYNKIGEGEGSTDAMAILNTIPLMAGWTIPFDAGIRFNLPLGFKIATSVNNLNIGYTMNAYDNYDGWSQSPFAGDTSFKLNQDFSWNVGFAFDPDMSWAFKPTFEADFVDLYGLIKDGDYSARALMNHFKAGAEIKGLWIFDIRGGYNSGYWTLGAALNLYLVRVEAAYFWQEFGSVAGEKGIDGLTVTANIGW